MIKYDEDGYIVVFDTPKIEAPEFRLYYDDAGNLICYSCEKLEGNYIVIDRETYAVARPDVQVIDGKIINISNRFVISKLKPSIDAGITCLQEDISIIANSTSKKTKTWKLDTYELN